jgi:nitric oxide reductase subunit B
MSIPAINVFTHGTHVTVAHTMGATIGINTMLLLAFVVDNLAVSQEGRDLKDTGLWAGFWVSNISLLIFWLALIIAGVAKARWQMSDDQIPFRSMMDHLRPFFIASFVAGTGIAGGLLTIIYTLLNKQRKRI